MIDLEARVRRLTWLQSLQPGNRVKFSSPIGEGSATVESIEPNRIWVSLERPGSETVIIWVWRDSGDCPGARICIEPADPAVGGGEAA